MSRIEDRIKELATRLSEWLNTDKKTAREQRAERVARLREEASARAQQAAARVQDFRESERAQRAAEKLNDLRSSDTAKRAADKFHDLRASETGQKAEHALSDLRQRDSVKKAEEGARKVLHDLFSGARTGGGDSGAGTGAADSAAE
jgi:membrane protein involved in colicin uptake